MVKAACRWKQMSFKLGSEAPRRHLWSGKPFQSFWRSWTSAISARHVEYETCAGLQKQAIRLQLKSNPGFRWEPMEESQDRRHTLTVTASLHQLRRPFEERAEHDWLDPNAPRMATRQKQILSFLRREVWLHLVGFFFFFTYLKQRSANSKSKLRWRRVFLGIRSTIRRQRIQVSLGSALSLPG